MLFKEKTCYIAVFIKFRNKTIHNGKVNIREVFRYLCKRIGKHEPYSIYKVVPLFCKYTQKLFPVLTSGFWLKVLHLNFCTKIYIIRIVLNIAFVLFCNMNKTGKGGIVKRLIASASNIEYQPYFILRTGSLCLSWGFFLCTSFKNKKHS